MASADVFIKVTEWIRSNGGFIHEALTFDEESRTMTLRSTDNTAKNNNGGKVLIKESEVLMKIPDKCLLTLDSVQSNEKFGPFLFQLIHSLQDKEQERDNDSCQNEKQLLTEHKYGDSKLFNNPNDLVLALYMSLIQKNDNDFHSAYLKTLPPPSSSAIIPRQWNDLCLDEFLSGTSVNSFIYKQKQGFDKDYCLICNAWGSLTSNVTTVNNDYIPPPELPSKSEVDHMLAMVESRCFGNIGRDKLDAMIPALDLLNHKRGGKEDKKIRDVRYIRREDQSIVLSAARDLCEGEPISITYGAKGNAQLLCRYGFCLHHNYEPDGSCNDVLEVVFKEVSSSIPIKLQIGPKSYSYFGFVRALESLYPSNSQEGINGEENDNNYSGASAGNDDMECFLNECENEQNGWDDFEMDEGDEEEDDTDGDSSKKRDIEALKKFIKMMRDLKLQYKMHEVDGIIEKCNDDKEFYSAILVKSEKETIDFFVSVAQLTLEKLDFNSCDKKMACVPAVENVATNTFMNEVAEAFMKIRYPFGSL